MESLEPASVDLVLTDLPYGTTANKWDSVLRLDKLWAAWKRVCKPGAAVVLFTQQPFTTVVAASNLKNLRTEWIWEKPQGTGFLNAKRYPLKNHENILVFCDRLPRYTPQKSYGAKRYSATKPGDWAANWAMFIGRRTPNVDGSRYPRTVLKYGLTERQPGTRSLHPTQKPVALCEYLIRTYSDEGHTVLDCCMGSGTTGVAAMNTGRKFIGIEREADYFAIAATRIAAAAPAAQAAA